MVHPQIQACVGCSGHKVKDAGRTDAQTSKGHGEGGGRGLESKASAEEPQEAAAAEDGATESGVQPPKAAAFPPGFSISEIKNKQRRHLMFTRWKQQQRKEKLAITKKLKKEREALGDEAPPKPTPKTIDNQRVYDETIVDPNDEEVAYDEATDEFASYFNKLRPRFSSQHQIGLVGEQYGSVSSSPQFYQTHMFITEEDWL
ncbi:Ribosome production factor 1 [Vulpes lagopus]